MRPSLGQLADAFPDCTTMRRHPPVIVRHRVRSTQPHLPEGCATCYQVCLRSSAACAPASLCGTCSSATTCTSCQQNAVATTPGVCVCSPGFYVSGGSCVGAPCSYVWPSIELPA